MSHLPSIVAVQASLTPEETLSPKAAKNLISDLALKFFDISNVNGTLLGHIKMFGESDSGSVIRANITDRRDSLRVILQGSEPIKKIELWINVIAYKIEKQVLEQRFSDVVREFTKSHKARLRVSVSKHSH